MRMGVEIWIFRGTVSRCALFREERSKVGEGTPKCWFPNSFFWPKLSGKNNKETAHGGGKTCTSQRNSRESETT